MVDYSSITCRAFAQARLTVESKGHGMPALLYQTTEIRTRVRGAMSLFEKIGTDFVNILLM